MRFATLLTMAAGTALAQQHLDLSLSYREEGSKSSDSLSARKNFVRCKDASKPSERCYFRSEIY